MKPIRDARATVGAAMGTTRRPLRAVAAVGAVLALGVVVSGCGSDDETTTSAGSELQTWAGGLCTAVGRYKASLAATRASLHVRQLSRPALQVAVQDASAATRELQHDLEELGSPPMPQADEAQKILDEMQAGLREQADKVRAVTTNASSTGSVKQAASNITDALTAATDESSGAVREISRLDPKSEVAPAFSDAGSCGSLLG
jgi:methyl-accepting chemotaxis protein